MSVTWPGTTEAFEQANIYARASGYISKRTVDIGSRVKAGDLLVEITAPEIEHQIAQARGDPRADAGRAATGEGEPRSRPGHLGPRRQARPAGLGLPSNKATPTA